MPPQSAVPRATSKRHHHEATATDASSSSSTSGSSSSSEEDSSDDETENALFRPVQTNAEGDSSSSSDNEDEEQGSDAEENSSGGEEKIAESTKKQKSAVAAKSPAKEKEPKPAAAASAPATSEFEDEMARKTTATVYVEGIPYKAGESDVVSHFASCGSVKEVRMPRYQDSGKPRGYAHVVFDAASSVAKALKLDGKYMLGRYLTVKRAERPRTLDAALQAQKAVGKAVKGCKTVFIKHLPYDVEETTVKEALASCGTIVSVRLPLWNHTKKLKGFGYVEFSTEDEAAAAAKRSGMKIGDRMVIISLDTPGSAPKASFRLADGRYWKKGEEAKQSLATKLKEKSIASQPSSHQKKNKRQKTG